MQHHVAVDAGAGKARSPIPSELVSRLAHKGADLPPNGFGLVACRQRHPKRVQSALAFFRCGGEGHTQAVGVKQLKRRGGPSSVGVVRVQDWHVVDLHRREHIQSLKFEGGGIKSRPSTRTNERGGVRPGGVLHPLHVAFMRAGVGVGQLARPDQVLQHEARHMGIHGRAAFNPNLPRRPEVGERDAVGRFGGAGREKGKHQARPQGPKGLHVQKLNGV